MNAPATLAQVRPAAAVRAEDLASLDLIRTLVAFDTTSRDSNLALIEWVRHYLEGHGVASTLTFALLEHRRMMAKVMEFVTDVMQSMATGRNAPPEVSAIYRDLYARAEQRAHALAEQNEALKQHAAGTPGAPSPSPYAEIAKVVGLKVAERVTDKVMAGMTPEMMQQLVGAMGGA